MGVKKEQSLSITVLISCMYQTDTSIIQRSNIQTDVVVINQCDKDELQEFDFVNTKGIKCHAKFICTTERGLSRSRNMAINNAWGDICLICDDDEKLEDDYEELIQNAYLAHEKENAILFIVERKDLVNGKLHPIKEQKVKLKQLLQSSSVQVTFRREDIINNRIEFDVMLGSGSGNGGGEDNKFLLDIRKKKLNIYYVPVCIGCVMPGNSLWFDGFTEQYMINRGWTTRRSLGSILGLFYIIVFAYRHLSSYRENMSFLKAFCLLMKGYFEKR